MAAGQFVYRPGAHPGNSDESSWWLLPGASEARQWLSSRVPARLRCRDRADCPYGRTPLTREHHALRERVSESRDAQDGGAVGDSDDAAPGARRKYQADDAAGCGSTG